MTPYQFAENDVIRATDLDGLEKNIAIDGSIHYGPLDMNGVNANILSNYSKPQQQILQAQQQAMKKGASLNQMLSVKPKPKTPITPKASKRIGTSDHSEDFASRKASEQKLIFDLSLSQSRNQFKLANQATISAPSPLAGYSDFERGMITNPLIQSMSTRLLGGATVAFGAPLLNPGWNVSTSLLSNPSTWSTAVRLKLYSGLGNAAADATYQLIKGGPYNPGSTIGNFLASSPFYSALPGAIYDTNGNFLETYGRGFLGDAFGNIPIPLGLGKGMVQGLENFTLPFLGNLVSDVTTGKIKEEVQQQQSATEKPPK